MTAAGESSGRLTLVAAWRQSTVFTDAERAALALAEEGTRVAADDRGATARPTRYVGRPDRPPK